LGKDERRIISSVCFLNRAVYDVALIASGFGNKGELSVNWPCVDTGEEPVNPLRNQRIAEVLKKQGMVHCSCLPWSFGQEGEEELKVKWPRGIATNAKGQFLIADNGDKSVKVFDSKGQINLKFNPQTDDADAELDIWDVATAEVDDKIYLFVGLRRPGDEKWEREVQVFNKTADLQHKFFVCRWDWRLTVSGRKVLLLARDVVDVHELSGEFVYSYGEGVFKNATCITATCDGHLMIVDRYGSCVYVFDVEGQQLAKFNIKCERDDYYRIGFHPTGEHFVVAGRELETDRLTLAIYTVNGEFVHRIQLDEEQGVLTGITVTVEGHIVVAF